jgi:hypothetical protein
MLALPEIFLRASNRANLPPRQSDGALAVDADRVHLPAVGPIRTTESRSAAFRGSTPPSFFKSTAASSPVFSMILALASMDCSVTSCLDWPSR